MSPSVPEPAFIGLDALSYIWIGKLFGNEKIKKKKIKLHIKTNTMLN